MPNSILHIPHRILRTAIGSRFDTRPRQALTDLYEQLRGFYRQDPASRAEPD